LPVALPIRSNISFGSRPAFAPEHQHLGDDDAVDLRQHVVDHLHHAALSDGADAGDL
jgi:hypothetical protein